MGFGVISLVVAAFLLVGGLVTYKVVQPEALEEPRHVEIRKKNLSPVIFSEYLPMN